MNYELATKWDDMTFGGSAMVGTIVIPREELVSFLGEPIKGDGNITERWLIKFKDGTIGTIFKNLKLRNMKENEWAIGGFGHYDKKTKENLSLRAVLNLIEKKGTI